MTAKEKKREKVVWITGAKGFIGRHLARFYADRGFLVYGIGHGYWPDVEAAKWGLSGWINGKIDATNLSILFTMSGEPQHIYHLAGGSAVGFSINNPLEDFSRTVNTTARLLDWVRQYLPDSTIVAVSSAAVYGDQPQARFAENDRLNPFSPYGYHKRAMELLCQNYSVNFGLSTAIVRLFSVYGPMLKKQLVWDLCCKLRAGTRRITLGGTGDECRDFINVSDAVRLLYQAPSIASQTSTVLNGGTGVATTVREMVSLVIDSWPASVDLEFSGIQRPGDPFSLVADNTALSATDFRFHTDIRSGIRQYVKWFKTCGEGPSKK